MSSNAKQGSISSYLKNHKIVLYGFSSIIGMTRTLVGFPFEHPMDSIKTQWQANPNLKSEYHIAKHIYQTKGIMGFYAGSIPNALRNFIKNAYRYPSLIVIPKLYSFILPVSLQDKKSFMRALTAVSLATSETFILCPFERLKVAFMTKEAGLKMSYWSFLKVLRQQLTKELYRGLSPLIVRQNLSWFVFLEADLMFKTITRKMMKINQDEVIPVKICIIISVLVALINTIIGMPFDMMKTYLQKFNPSGKIRDAFFGITQAHGFKGLFTGWRLRAAMYFTHALFAVPILEKLEFLAK